MSKKIRVTLADWQFNAGIVGLCNILEHAGDEVVKNDNYIEFYPEHLERFEVKYFDYLIEKYKDILSIYKIISFEKIIDFYEESNFDGINEDNLKNINEYIDNLKKYLKSNSYKAAYDLIDHSTDILGLEKKLKTIKLKKKQEIKDVLPDIKSYETRRKQKIYWRQKCYLHHYKKCLGWSLFFKSSNKTKRYVY